MSEVVQIPMLWARFQTQGLRTDNWVMNVASHLSPQPDFVPFPLVVTEGVDAIVYPKALLFLTTLLRFICGSLP